MPLSPWDASLCAALNKTLCSCLGVCTTVCERERESGMDNVLACVPQECVPECVCVRERDSVCVSYIAPGSCYGHILITRSMLDYVLWACNITPSGQSPNRFSVSWPLTEKKTHIRGLAKTLFSVLQHL